MRTAIPEKLFFKIGEVSDIVGVKPHVLRYWETEFSSLRPRKTRSGHRLYRRSDVELVVVIKRLLHEEGYTIAGARKRLGKRPEEEPSVKGLEAELSNERSRSRQVLQELKEHVEGLLALVEDK